MRNLFRQSSRRRQRRLPSTLSAEVQLLEQRTLPAGTVIALVAAGSITLTGDNNSNQLTINVTATGITLTGTDGTLIRRGARSASTVTIAGSNTFRDVNIDLNGGNDALTVNVGTALAAGNLTALRNLRINTGVGDDSVTVNNATSMSGSITVGGGLAVDLGAGNDRLTTTAQPAPSTLVAAPINVAGNVRITGSTGDDVVALEALTVGKHLTIETGSGNDSVVFVDSTITGNANVSLSAGNDDLDTNGLTVNGTAIFDAGAGDDGSLDIANSFFASLVRISLQTGNDGLELSSEFGGVLEVTGGVGNDFLGIGDAIFSKSSSFNLGAGDDTVFIDEGEFLASTSFDLGDGVDRLEIGFIPEIGDPLTPIFRALSSFNLGAGNDLAIIASANFQANSSLNLGSGDDELAVNGAPLTRGEDVVITVDAGDGVDTLFYDEDSLDALGLSDLALAANTVFENKEDLGVGIVDP
ncbi:MAG: hypothetical protein ACKV2Q_26070 [Planctomycetaceae bacterium]